MAGKPDIVHDRVHRSWLDGVLLPNAGRQIGVKIFAPDTERSFLGKSPISRISSKTGTSVYYYHLDHLGSLNIASDDGGNRVQAVTYYPFGEVLTNTGTVDLKYKFTGQEYDPDSKLYYFGARYYDPAIARFLSPDSIVQSPGNPQSLARYSYALNNPLAYIDPTGHFSIGSFFGSLFGGFLGTLTFAFTWNPILAGVVAGGVSGAFSGNLKNIAMGAVMGGLSGALGSVVQANFGAAGSIAMVGIGAGSAVAKGGWSSLAYMGAGMVGGAAGYGLGGYLNQFASSNAPVTQAAGYKRSIQVLGEQEDIVIHPTNPTDDDIKDFLGAYRGSGNGIYADNDLIYYDRDTSYHGFLTGGTSKDFGILASSATGQGFQDSYEIYVWGEDNEPTSWQLRQYAPTGKYDGATGWAIYGWEIVPEAVATQNPLTLKAYNALIFGSP